MATTTVQGDATASVEALRRGKAAENEWDARLSGARREAEATLARLRNEGDAAVKAARAEADRERAARVDRARADANVTAEGILAEGRAEAERALHGEGRRPVDKREAILEVLLGAFGRE